MSSLLRSSFCIEGDVMLRHSRALGTGLLAVVLSGCDGSPSGPEGAGNITIRLSQTGDAAAFRLAGASQATLGNVALSRPTPGSWYRPLRSPLPAVREPPLTSFSTPARRLDRLLRHRVSS
jgi:hypothetical protein